MAQKEYHLHNGKKGAALAIRVTPRARENEVVEVLNDGTVRIRLAATPNDQEINDLLINFLAETLGVPATNIDIVAGHSGRDKLVSIINMSAVEAHHKIVEHMG